MKWKELSSTDKFGYYMIVYAILLILVVIVMVFGCLFFNVKLA